MEASAWRAPAGLGRRPAPVLLRLRSDDQLVALFRLGNEEAFRVIHDRYRARLLAYARQMLGGSAADAEDALQDVFLRAYHALRTDGRPVTLRAWLYRVAHNRCIDELRRGGASGAARPAADAAEAADGRQDPVDEVQQREALRRLIEDVRRLPEQQRSALLMREMEGLTYQELAGALDVTVPAVKSLLVRARLGLVEARTARDTACVDIRADLAGAHDRGVRASGRTRRHLRDCAPCRDYRAGLKGLEREIAALAPAGGPWGGLAKLLGLGGSGAAAGGATAGGGAVAGGTLAGGAAAVTTAKVAAVVCCAALVGGGAVDATRHDAAPAAHAATPAAHATSDAPREAFSRALAPLAAATGRQLRRVAAAAAPAHHAASRSVAVLAAPVVVHRDPSGALGAETDDERAAQAQAGGVLAPADDEPTTAETTTTDEDTTAQDGDAAEPVTAPTATATTSSATPPPATGTGTTTTAAPAATGAPAAP